MKATTDKGAQAPPSRAASATTDSPVPANAEEAPAEKVEKVAARAAERAATHLLASQHSDGWWKGDLETNVTMDAEDLLLRRFLGILDDRTQEATARWIRSRQRDDGTWATFYGGPGELSTTVEAYVALRLAGDDPQAPHMAAAAAWVREEGGIASCRVFTRIWLALFG